MMHILILFMLVVWTPAKASLTITGLSDQADLLGRDVTFTFTLLQDGQPVNVSQTRGSFTIQWSFTGVSASSMDIIGTLLGFGNGTIRATSSNEKKYQVFTDKLVIKNLEFTDAGEYNCTLLSPEETLTAQLYVLETPRCHNLKTNLSVNEKASFDCHVSYSGNKAPTLSWKHNKQNITNSYKQETSPDFANKTEIVTMHFTAKKEYDGFMYRCHIQYHGTKFHYLCQSKHPLNVFYPVQKPTIQLDPYYNGGNRNFEAGTNIRLQCMARGHPHPQYKWEFLPFNQSSSSKIELSTIPHYKIINAHRNSMGNYTCVASNRVNDTEYHQDQTVFIGILERNLEKNQTSIHNSLPWPQYRVSNSEEVKSTPLRPKADVGDINMSPYAIGALASAALAILLIVAFITLAIKFRAREHRLRERFSRTYDEMMDDQEQELLDDNIQPANVDESQGQYGRMRQYWEVPRKDVRLLDVLATGSYCEVWRGRMRKESDNKDVVKVAIKKVLDDASEQGRKFFLAEMEVLKMLKSHPSVISLIGCYTLNEPWMLMVEYAQEGTLQKYLQKHRPGEEEVEINNSAKQSVRLKNKHKIDAHKLLVLAAQIVSGLQHLQKFKLIYYRLCASNILVGKGGICKLSGFGFPQDMLERNLYEKDSFPVRWMAPESLRDKVFSTKSDVWAYGIVVWEILHFGIKPYSEIESDDTVQEEVLSGYRLPQPSHCSTELYTQLVQCWKVVPDHRPNYEGILQVLRQLDLNPTSHIVLEDLPSMCTTDTEQATDAV